MTGLVPDTCMDMDRLAQMDMVFSDRAARGVRSGYAYQVFGPAGVVHQAATGFQDRESGIPMTLDTGFRLASLSKIIISAMVFQLIEEGKLDLLDPLARYLPAAARLQVLAGTGPDGTPEFEPPAEPVRILHLLNHTSGLGASGHPEYPAYGVYAENYARFFACGSLAAAADLVLTLPLAFQPGTAWGYSFSTDILARVIELVDQRPLEESLQTRICAPLDLATMRFNGRETLRDGMAVAYSHDANRQLVRASISHLDDIAFPLGGGGLVSGIPDFGRFLIALMNGGCAGGAHILSPASVAAITTNALPPALRPVRLELRMFDSGFGMGAGVMTHDAPNPSLLAAGDYFWAGATDTFFFASPSRRVGGVICSQYWPNEHTIDWGTMYGFANMVSAAALNS
ncbi:serine hydrolase domain-containing protein [Hyphomonas sp.]|uniref:serine hydrolase domain-containing protein n=1 Tax=Hyphomonas sp. TaxID=87 RepID=UPI003F70D902